MSNKQVLQYKEVKAKIIKAVDTIADPVRQTISPKGRNVIFQDNNGNIASTNDGATIAKAIQVKDPVENAIIDIIKGSSLKTNTEAGDGTSTSILLSQVLIKEGLKLVDEGVNPMVLKGMLNEAGDTLVSRLKKKVLTVKTDEETENIAAISANNDREIAKDIVKVVKVVGLDGMVFLDGNNKPTTEVIEEKGFHLESGLFAPELAKDKTRFTATYQNVPVFITDKRLYYPEEGESILKAIMEAGLKEVVIVAKDFLAQIPNFFLANHTKGVVSILMVKDPTPVGDGQLLNDLATYLGGKVISEKNGSLVNKVKISDFCIAKKVFADPSKTLITSNKTDNKALDNLIKAVRNELKKDKDDEANKKRLARLTNGMVTIKVGAATQIEMVEKLYRYEDAINATRAAMRDGYLIGGGVSIFHAYQGGKGFPEVIRPLMKKFCEANLRQIAENCGKHPESLIQYLEIMEWPQGYNALTDATEDLQEAGVFDPFKVTEMAILNSISVAGQIISSDFIIVNEIENEQSK